MRVGFSGASLEQESQTFGIFSPTGSQLTHPSRFAFRSPTMPTPDTTRGWLELSYPPHSSCQRQVDTKYSNINTRTAYVAWTYTRRPKTSSPGCPTVINCIHHKWSERTYRQKAKPFLAGVTDPMLITHTPPQTTNCFNKYWGAPEDDIYTDGSIVLNPYGHRH